MSQIPFCVRFDLSLSIVSTTLEAKVRMQLLFSSNAGHRFTFSVMCEITWLHPNAKRIIKSLKQKQLKFLYSLRCQAIENTGLQYKCHVYMTDKVDI